MKGTLPGGLTQGILKESMTKMAKVLLGLAIGCLVVGGVINIGWINPGKLDALYVLLPVGGVFLGLFLIVLVLSKESTVHEEDQHLSEPANEGPSKPLPPDFGGHKEAAQRGGATHRDQT